MDVSQLSQLNIGDLIQVSYYDVAEWEGNFTLEEVNQGISEDSLVCRVNGYLLAYNDRSVVVGTGYAACGEDLPDVPAGDGSEPSWFGIVQIPLASVLQIDCLVIGWQVR